MGKLLGILATVVIIAIIIYVFFFGKGFGLGKGTGDGEGNEISAGQVVSEEEPVVQNKMEEEKDETDNITVLIEVKQGQYLLDGEECTLSDIEAILMSDEVENTLFILEDNYASAKAWDEIKGLFTRYEISVIEQ